MSKIKQKTAALWFTGLSGSGKTSIALKIKELLEARGKSVFLLDGDEVRKNKHKHLGFSREDIRENIRLIAEYASLEKKNHDVILIPVISPYREDRMAARSIIGDGFAELFINTPLDVCMRRDVKGLYTKALAGEIENFIGLHPNSPYEPPESPDIEIQTSEMNIDKGADYVIKFLQDKNFI